jgi:hypothetical protein
MTSPKQPAQHGHEYQPHDPVESVVPAMPIVLPMVGAALMFLLAFIAIYMA